MPNSSTSPVMTPYCGSPPGGNPAIRTPGAYRRSAPLPVPTLEPVETGLDARLLVLDEAEWTARRDAHEARVDRWLRPHLARRQERVAHPVEDFLFTYYSHRPAALRRWHPGYGVGLERGSSYAGMTGYVDRGGIATVAIDLVLARRP